MENDLYMKMLTAKEEAVKFGRLAGALESLVDYATRAKEKAAEMEDNLKTYARMLDDKDNLDMDNPDDVEWSKQLDENIADLEKQLADPLKSTSNGRKPSLKVLLMLIKDYADHDNFASPLVERAEAEEDEERKKKRAA